MGRPLFFQEWEDIEEYFEEIVENNKDMNANMTFEQLKEELIRDFYQGFMGQMQPKVAIQIGESVYSKNPIDLPSPKHQSKDSNSYAIVPEQAASSNNDGFSTDRSYGNGSMTHRSQKDDY